jgi:hypothetical protein
MLPSAAPAVASTLGETVVLGKRIAVRGGGVDMTAVGNAIHGFLAADRPALLPDDRMSMAAAILKRFRVDANIEPSDVLEVASRLWRWIDARFTGARLHREWPVLSRTPAGTVMSGTADLVITTPTGIVVIDHRTFPGMDAVAVERAMGYSGQLAAYSTAICAATGTPPASTWIHFPVLGQVVEVSLTAPTI